MTIVFKISDNLKGKLIDFYKNCVKEKTPPYATFQAQNADTTITLYDSGKVMFQGVSADIESSLWTEAEKIVNKRIIDTTGKKDDSKKDDSKEPTYNFNSYSTLGSDEVGTGDYFGPIVVTAAFVSKENQSFLKELKVGDSKKILDENILKIAPKIIEKIPYTTYIISNKDYNSKFAEELNMNKLKAIFHNKALLSLLDKDLNPEKIVVDQFVNPKKYFEYLSEVPKVVKNIIFTTKAEDKCLSVACASIISRYVFLNEMQKLSKIIGKEIPKGANKYVDEFAQNLIKEHGFNYLQDFVKLNFKNTEKINENIKKEN
ncbi:MAG: ribonuclease HIII [Bacilli bacterium]